MGEKSNTILVHVSYRCKVCGQLFNSVPTYCTHKRNHHHSNEFQHSRSIVFEEYISEPNQNESDFDPVALSDDVSQIIQLDHLIAGEVKQEPPDPVSISETVYFSTNSRINNHTRLVALTYNDRDIGEPSNHSEIKTEWAEYIPLNNCELSQTANNDSVCHADSVSVIKSLENENHKKSCYYNKTETQSSFNGSGVGVSHGQINDIDHDPFEDFDVTQSTTTPSISTSILTTETEHESHLNENNSDSDDDIISVDDPSPSPPPSLTANKIVSPIGPTAAATRTIAILNHLVLPYLTSQICSGVFNSSAQLRIHVAICQLYNGKANTQESAGTSPSQVVRSRSRCCSRSRAKTVRVWRGNGNNLVSCDECSTRIRRCTLKTHMKAEHGILVEDSDRKYTCSICGSAFRNNYSLRQHSIVHSNERPFVCSFPECHLGFKYERNLKDHMKKLHPHSDQMV